jgi:lysozyme
MNLRLVEQLRRDEGEKLHAYEDHLGFLTIGVGRLIDVRRGGGITREESAYLLANDIRRVDADLRRRYAWFAELDEVRQAALVNMAFQLGPGGLAAFRKMLTAVRLGKWEEARAHALDSLWAKQTPNRAKRVARQLATGEWT